LIFNFSPAFYWLFNYLFDIITSVIWFCYILAIYCIFDVAFNGLPNSRTSTTSIPIEFANAWDLRIQFYPLTILITLPTLPFVYLLTKIFPSDILVCIYSSSSLYFFNYFYLVWIISIIFINCYSCSWYYCTNNNVDY